MDILTPTDYFNTFKGRIICRAGYEAFDALLKLTEVMNITKDESIGWPEFIFRLRHSIDSAPGCSQCKVAPLVWQKTRYSSFCSKKCAAMAPSTRNKHAETMTERHGSAHASQSDTIKAKIAETNMLRYGTTVPSKNHAVRDKISTSHSLRSVEDRQLTSDMKVANHQKAHGVDHHMQIETVKERVRASIFKKYGVDNALQSKEIKEQIKKKNIETYGVENVFMSGDIQKRIRKTKIEIYGTEHPTQNTTVQSRRKQNSLMKYGVDHHMKVRSIREHQQRKLKEAFDSPEYVKKWFSKTEVSLREALSKRFPDLVVEFNNRKKIGRELDLFFPQHNLAVEVNGVYYHSTEFKSKTAHLDKLAACQDSNLQLMQFWDYQIESNLDLVVSMIGAKCGLTEKTVYARLTTLSVATNAESRQFFSENHLAGPAVGFWCMGLKDRDGSFISMMLVGRCRFSKKYDFEIVRFATKQNVSVVGGFSKLLKAFDLQGSLVSYADRMISNGNVYTKNGFTFSHASKPSYFYAKAGKRKFSRYETQKHLLPKILGDQFDPSISETENMMKSGYHKVYDCGNMVFVKQPSTRQNLQPAP